MLQMKPLGQIAYEAYCKHFGMKNTPDYETLPDKIKDSLDAGITTALIVYLERLIHNHYEQTNRISSRQSGS